MLSILGLNYFSFSQEIFVKDINTNLTITNAHIAFSNKSIAYTNQEGVFIIPDKIDSIKISCIGSKSLELKNKGYDKVIYWEQEITHLEEIELKNKKVKTLKHKKINFSTLAVKDFTYNEGVVTFIPFPNEIKNNKIKIKSIIVNVVFNILNKYFESIINTPSRAVFASYYSEYIPRYSIFCRF